MNKLEAQTIIENSGNYIEEEIEDVMDVYEEVVKHIGFEDNRRDKRFIVKFHDIFYYSPDGIEEAYLDGLFDGFCEEQYENIMDYAETEKIDIDYMLTKMCVGHYQAFVVDIPEITEENAADLAMQIYDEFNYEGKEYVKNYINIVNELQNLEDNYMDYWIEFLECNEVETKYIKEIRESYEKDKERRNAQLTLAK